MSSSDMYPITLLVEEMKSEDTESRITAMRKLRVIAAALGPERTRNELVPYLKEQVEDDDEVLLVMAEEIGGFVELVGGGDFAAILLEPLGSLAMVEETVVREKAVESACSVINCLVPAAVLEFAFPIIQRLAAAEWFTAKVSCCGLLAIAYGRLRDADARAQIRELFKAMCADETPMVRRAASKAIGALVAACEAEYALSEFLPLFNALSNDEQDSVRLLAIENCVAFSRVFTEAQNQEHILPLVRSCAMDKSWRVRNNVAKEFFALSDAMGAPTAAAELVNVFVRLLQDPEPEVRASAARNTSGFVGLLGGETFISEILPSMAELINDPAPSVRSATAGCLMDASKALGHDATVAHTLPLIVNCLRDELAGAEVRLRVLDSLGKIADTLGSAALESHLLPVVLELSSNRLWRVRERIIQRLPLLASTLGAGIFEEKLLPLYLASCEDQVNAVRTAAMACAQDLAKALGGGWIRARLLPKLASLYSTEGGSYLLRITVLGALRGCCSDAAFADVAVEALPILLRGLKDAVPNVRFVAARTFLEALSANAFERTRIAAEIRPALEPLRADSDSDVQFFANAALAKC